MSGLEGLHLKQRVILGIDPGSQFAGFGAVRVSQRSRGGLDLLSFGVIAPPQKLDFNARIGIIASEFEALFERLQPDVTVIEKVFLGKNVDSAFKLGHARGIAIASAVRCGSDIVEYAPRTVKKGITGSGAATKEQVQIVLLAAMKLNVVHGEGGMRADASDALALAYYHARQLEVARHLQKGAEL